MILSTAVDFDDLDGMGGISDIDIDDDKSAVSSVAGSWKCLPLIWNLICGKEVPEWSACLAPLAWYFSVKNSLDAGVETK